MTARPEMIALCYLIVMLSAPLCDAVVIWRGYAYRAR